jgi:hypothetical protein
MSPTSPDGRLSSHSDTLSAYLWDLRSQAEAKLRCLTRLQQELSEYERSASSIGRAGKREKIIQDLTDIVTLSQSLRSLAQEAFAAAQMLA